MSEENQNIESPKPNTDLPKFELPKAAAPTVSTPSSMPKIGATPVTPSQRPASFGASAATMDNSDSESAIFIVVDAIAVVVAVAFTVLTFLG